MGHIQYIAALEEASIRHNIRPFVHFVAEEMGSLP
jgi:hypothetical protein